MKVNRFYYETVEVSPGNWETTKKVMYTTDEFFREWRARERGQAMMAYAILHDDALTVGALINEFA